MTNKLSTAAQELGRRGGQSTSTAKQIAARDNGRLGGRPDKMTAIRNQIDDIRERVTQLSLAGKSDTTQSDNLKRREMALWEKFEKLTLQEKNKNS